MALTMTKSPIVRCAACDVEHGEQHHGGKPKVKITACPAFSTASDV